MAFGFREMQVYQLARQVARETSVIASALAAPQWRVAQQLVAASVSVMLNIAEGSGEHSTAEKARFYRMSRRSAYEVVAVLDHLGDIDVLHADEALMLEAHLDRICGILTSMILKLGRARSVPATPGKVVSPIRPREAAPDARTARGATPLRATPAAAPEVSP